MRKMILPILTILLFILVVINVRAEGIQKEGNQLTGRYKLPNGIVIQLFKKKNKLFGEIIDVANFNGGQLYDVKNPDNEKRQQLLKGKTIIRDLEYDNKTGKCAGGKIYAPGKGMWVDLEIEFVHDEHLVVRGSKFLFSKKVIWEKIF
jgi:uncharacterized protein (DUF2147 family)